MSQLGGDARPERDHGCVAPPPSRERAVCGGRGGAQGGRDDPNLLRVLELLERRDALRSRREWAEVCCVGAGHAGVHDTSTTRPPPSQADRVKEELVALHVRLDDGNKRWSIRPPGGGGGGGGGSPSSSGAAPSLRRDARPERAKRRKHPLRIAKVRAGHLVFLYPERLPAGASPHQPHLVLEETWPIRGERGGNAPRHLRLQPQTASTQPSGEPFLLEEGAVSALYTGFRAAWLAVGAAGDAALRETLLRALSWYCDENAWRPPAESIRQIIHSGAVSKEQSLELAAEMRALTGGGGEGYASGGEGSAGARPSGSCAGTRRFR